MFFKIKQPAKGKGGRRMSNMVVFEVVSTFKSVEMKRIFVVNYVSEDERLFRVDLTEAEFLAEDMILHIGVSTVVKRHTESGFVVKHFQAGDKLILTAKGDWRVKRSFVSYAVVVCKRISLLHEDFAIWRTLKKNDLGTIERQIEQSFCYIGCRCR